MTAPRPVLTMILTIALLATPLAARAQAPPGKAYRLGWLHPLPIPPDWEEGFHQGLRELGYAEGKDLVIERRWGGGLGQLPAMAAELVQLNVDVLIAGKGGGAPPP